MATNIFLGKPPKYIEDWYKSHSTKRETIVTYKDGSMQQLLIEGMLTLSSIPNKSNATKVEIGSSVTSIESQAFQQCDSLTSVTIPNSVTKIKNQAFQQCDSLTSIMIPDSVTSIGGNAFSACRGIMNVTIPDSVTSIGQDAFLFCDNLQEITFERFTCNYVVSKANQWGIGIGMGYNTFLVVAYCSDGVVIINDDSGSSSDGGDRYEKTHVKYTASSGLADWENDIVGELANNSIPNKSYIAEVKIGTHVTSIGKSAFEYCGGLTSVTIPNSVTSIGKSAFRSCSSLTSVTISNRVTSIGDYVFYSCIGLTNVTIPNSVTDIGQFAFAGCSSLTSVTISNRVTSIGENAFYYCRGLTNVTIPNSVTSIGGNAFSGCSGLTSVTFLGKTLEQIKNIEDKNGNKYYSWGINESLIVPEQASIIEI